MVKRMDVIATVDETHWGEYVLYADYAALEAENARLLDVLASRSKYSIEPTTKVSADSFLLAQNAKLRKALSECVEALEKALPPKEASRHA